MIDIFIQLECYSFRRIGEEKSAQALFDNTSFSNFVPLPLYPLFYNIATSNTKRDETCQPNLLMERKQYVQG